MSKKINNGQDRRCVSGDGGRSVDIIVVAVSVGRRSVAHTGNVQKHILLREIKPNQWNHVRILPNFVCVDSRTVKKKKLPLLDMGAKKKILHGKVKQWLNVVSDTVYNISVDAISIPVFSKWTIRWIVKRKRLDIKRTRWSIARLSQTRVNVLVSRYASIQTCNIRLQFSYLGIRSVLYIIMYPLMTLSSYHGYTINHPGGINHARTTITTLYFFFSCQVRGVSPYSGRLLTVFTIFANKVFFSIIRSSK